MYCVVELDLRDNLLGLPRPDGFVGVQGEGGLQRTRPITGAMQPLEGFQRRAAALLGAACARQGIAHVRLDGNGFLADECTAIYLHAVLQTYHAPERITLSGCAAGDQATLDVAIDDAAAVEPAARPATTSEAYRRHPERQRLPP